MVAHRGMGGHVEVAGQALLVAPRATLVQAPACHLRAARAQHAQNHTARPIFGDIGTWKFDGQSQLSSACGHGWDRYVNKNL